MIDSLALVLLLGLASYRVTRLITRDSITERLRQWVASRAYDQALERWRPGPWRTLAQWQACPFCVGVWVTVALWAWWTYMPGGRPVVVIAAACGAQAYVSSRPAA